jgi:similar to stage IV sporulation protein
VADSGRSGLRLLHGMGRVYARTWYDRTVRIPLQRQVRVYTGEKNCYLALEWGRKRINLYGNSSITPADCDKIIRTQKLSLLGIALPLTLVWEQCRQYRGESQSLSPEKARQLGEELLLGQLEKQLGTEGSITSTRFAAVERNGVLLVTMTAECLEQIGEQVPIETEEAS